MSTFDDIRPYKDSEVRAVLDRLVNEPELIDTILRFKFNGVLSRIFRPLIEAYLKYQLKRLVQNFNSVRDLQVYIERYVKQVIEDTTDGLTMNGLEALDTKKPHLFISNHRDIAMDPAFINYILHSNGMDTMRIAIGDNLLGKDWIADLMRLNKSFVVKRSVKTVREKLTASKQLSHYMYESVTQDNANMWIAQREGRAKDGNDQTNPAVLSMLLLNKPKTMPIEDYLDELRIVPVSISYEYDPCDIAKAKELLSHEESGTYEKGAHEDIQSIAKGITGKKGRVHIEFGQPLESSLQHPLDCAKNIADELDRQIQGNYRILPSNLAAAAMLGHEFSDDEIANLDIDFPIIEMHASKAKLIERFNQEPRALETKIFQAYAAPVFNKLKVINEGKAKSVELASSIAG